MKQLTSSQDNNHLRLSHEIIFGLGAFVVRPSAVAYLRQFISVVILQLKNHVSQHERMYFNLISKI